MKVPRGRASSVVGGLGLLEGGEAIPCVKTRRRPPPLVAEARSGEAEAPLSPIIVRFPLACAVLISLPVSANSSFLVRCMDISRCTVDMTVLSPPVLPQASTDTRRIRRCVVVPPMMSFRQRAARPGSCLVLALSCPRC